ncbi:hypothetical protein OO184_21715 [Photorhabdus sp. APURE]|uniref:hypothetical protein n=1 Tax=Photorhabdus aballayi TaxID=2991723 RepID=UPI00223D6FB0|nr:hypothetical protein [Photorhabdus aballayi]MCW7550475.1 hypothetical protein [Photorhabdus aballayi]
MFKKLLTVGVLAASIALTGGIGTALAASCPGQDVSVAGADSSGLKYSRIVVNPYDNFANVFTRYESSVGKTIKWYFKGRYGSCDYNGSTAYAAYYEGREV